MLQLKEEAIIMCKDYLFHHTIVFNHFKNFDDVQVLIQFFFTFVQLIVRFCRFYAPELLFSTTVSTSEEVHDGHACTVSESSLIQDQVEYVV